ncbi:MAG: CHAT domain-containing tetratricopeptide repeat protein [Thermoanaerobaculia bacterium]
MRLAALGIVLAVVGPLAPSALPAQTTADAMALYQAGKVDEALAAFRVIAARDAVTAPAEAATARNGLCVLLMNRGGYQEALPECLEALRLREATHADSTRLAKSLNNVGLVLQYLGRYGEGEGYFRRALALNRAAGDSQSETINQSNLGLLLLAAGRYRQALATLAAGERVAAEHAGEAWSREQRQALRINRGAVLEKLGALREALELYRGLLDSGDPLEPSRAAALSANLGSTYARLGDPVRAESYLRAAQAGFERIGDQAALSNVWLNLALVAQINRRDPRTAEQRMHEALALAEQSGDRSEEIQDLFYLGRLLIEGGRLDEATAIFRRCLARSEESGSAEGRWSALEGLGRVAHARGDLGGAVASFLSALDRIEEVRESLDPGPFRAGFFGDKRSVYVAAVEALTELEAREPGRGHAEAALAVVERAKARQLLDLLGGGAGGAGMPLDAVTMRQRLDDGETLIEYFVGGDSIFSWRVDRGGVRELAPRPAAPILAAVESLHRDLAERQPPDPARIEFLRAQLLAAARLDSAPGARLRVAPDGRLHYLPFELLLSAADGNSESPVVTYLPSGSALVGATSGASEPREAFRVLGFGSPPAERLAADGAIEHYSPLPESERELESIAARLGPPSELRIGSQATVAELARLAPRGARVVHFASHTVIDEHPGGSPAILLAPSPGNDGHLHADELAQISVPTRLAVLATCQSAIGEAEDGRGFATLSGALLGAGARAVVVTLWDVGDAATAAFMEQFYWQLARGRPPERALAAAKRSFRADPRWNNPSYWAPFVLVGDGRRPLVETARWRWLAIGGALLAALAALGFAARRS